MALWKRGVLAYVEGSIESSHNRHRVSKLSIFHEGHKRGGIGTALMRTLLTEAERSGAGMAALETQSCRENTFAFDRKSGFDPAPRLPGEALPLQPSISSRNSTLSRSSIIAAVSA